MNAPFKPTHVRPLSQLEASSLGVTTRSAGAASAIKAGIKGSVQSGEVDAPAFEVSNVFAYQSYFDTTLLSQALLRQPVGDQIVPSTLQIQQVAGYAIGLHPSSETPVAIQFDTGASQGASPTFRLKPGEVIRPFGRPKGAGSPAQFSGFRWGLPFGWLGGGSAMLVVMRTADASVDWRDRGEVIFHRVRMAIVDYTNIGVTDVVPNWPTRFPWPYARYSDGTVSGVTQRGSPALAVTPTRTIMRLVTGGSAGLAASSDMRIFTVGAEAWAMDVDGYVDGVSTDWMSFVDYTWGSWTPAGSAYIQNAKEVDLMPDIANRLACNYNNGILLGAPAVSDLIGTHVDFIRYGVL